MLPFSRPGLIYRVRKSFGGVLAAVLAMVTVDRSIARLVERGYRPASPARVISMVLNFLGYRTAAERGYILVDHPDGLVTIDPSPEKLAVEIFLLFLLAWLVLRLVRSGPKSIRALAAGAFIAAFSCLGRFLAGMLMYIEHDEILLGASGQAALNLFDAAWLTIPFVIGAGFALDRLTRGDSVVELQVPTRTRRELLAACAAMIGVSGLAGLTGTFVPPGADKAGRILIDDRLCGIWEPTARRLDTDWYGDFPTYSFTSLAEWLGKWFTIDVNVGRSYDDKLLGNYDILIIKTPEIPIPDRDAEAIDRFVRRGGGLLLIGDHTNLLGMGTHLNALSAKYGIRFRYDSVSEASTGGFVNYFGPRFGRHVGALHVDHLEFMTSCSLDLSGSAETVVAVDGCRREPHDYAASSYFGRHGPHPEMEHGRTVLAATVRVGKGQVAAFTDSTVWSSFAVFQFDREKLAMDLIRMLNRRDSPYRIPMRALSAIMSILTLIAAVGLITWRMAPSAIICGTLGLWLGFAAADDLHRRIYAWPEPHSKVDEVAFLWQGGACAFPPVLGTPESLAADRCFDTLLVTVQRLGLVPRVAYTYESDFLGRDTRAMFVIAPVVVPPPKAVDRLRAFVGSGGHLVILDDYTYNERGSAKSFLAAFDLPITYHRDETDAALSRIHVHLGGGMKQIQVPAVDTIVAVKAYGRGRIVYMSDAVDYSRKGLGHCFARPWKAARDRYETIYLLLRDILQVAPENRRFYGILE